MTDNEFLLAVREYIEAVEVKIEAEWGYMRDLDELISAGEMPPIYAEVLKRIEAWVVSQFESISPSSP